MSYQGIVDLEDTFAGSVLVTSSGSPTNADAAPTFRVYGPSGFLESGTSSFKDTGSITGATNASPIVITSASHGLTTGTRVTITGVDGNTGANGTFTITRVSADTFSLDGSSGTGSYTSGGTWNVTGLYGVSITVAGDDGYEKGDICQVLVTYEVSSTVLAQIVSFNVA